MSRDRPKVYICEWCHKPSHGEGIINGSRYCNDGPTPTCYTRASWAETERSRTSFWRRWFVPTLPP